MEGEHSPKPERKLLVLVVLVVVLVASLLLNTLLLARHFIATSPPCHLVSRVGSQPGWAAQAAREAEEVAATDCSGHGHAFLDGVRVGGKPRCECNKCFSGPDCSARTPNCTADAENGDPTFLEPYWMRHAAASAVVFSGWHRMSYRTTNGYTSVELENHIRQLHKAVRNAVVDDKHVVFAAGSIQLLNALVYALSPDKDNTPPASVVATAPYYPVYKSQTVLFNGEEYEWKGTTTRWSNLSRSSTKNFIEFVTSPNNPDNLLYKPVLAGSSTIVDRAYYWPHFTHIPTLADEDVMLFTMSKLSGHAGSRFGWALIRDANVAKKVAQYIGMNTMGASRDTQLRMLKLVKVMLVNLHKKDDIFAFGHDTMKTRWRKLNAVVSRSNRFSLQKIPPQYCTYFKRIREPSPAYAWVKCVREEDTNCYKVMLKANIISRSGIGYEASSRYTRLSLIKSQDDFDSLLERMSDLVNG